MNLSQELINVLEKAKETNEYFNPHIIQGVQNNIINLQELNNLKLTKAIEGRLSFVLKFNEDIYKTFQNWVIKEHYNDFLKIFKEKENKYFKNVDLFLKQVEARK